MTQAPPPHTAAGGMMQPHRGTMILVFGILGLVGVCIIFGILAWVMGQGDLKAMREGRMDPTGEGLTNAGRICGIIAVILNVLGICIGLGFLALALAGAAAGAAGGAGG